MDHIINQSRVLVDDTNGHTQIIIFWLYCLTARSPERSIMLGKVERKRRRQQPSAIGGLDFKSDRCTVGRLQGLGWGQIMLKNIYLLRVDSNVIVFNELSKIKGLIQITSAQDQRYIRSGTKLNKKK